MTSAPTAHPTSAPTASRLALKPGTATGYVDGGWWPRSRDLGAELPALVPLLAARLGPVERVSFHLGDWDGVGTSIRAGGSRIKLSGFRTQPGGTLDVSGARGRVTLLVVPPGTAPQTADDVLAAAGRGDNADTVASLLGSAADDRT